MRLLVDSHVAVWWLDDDTSLGTACRDLVARADEVFFSAITPWELGIKRALGKLSMPDGLTAALEAGGFTPLAISIAHAERAPALPAHHRDPFVRMLVAQAQLESLIIVTADPTLSAIVFFKGALLADPDPGREVRPGDPRRQGLPRPLSRRQPVGEVRASSSATRRLGAVRR